FARHFSGHRRKELPPPQTTWDHRLRARQGILCEKQRNAQAVQGTPPVEQIKRTQEGNVRCPPRNIRWFGGGRYLRLQQRLRKLQETYPRQARRLQPLRGDSAVCRPHGRCRRG